MDTDRKRWFAVVPALVLPFLGSLFYFVLIEPGTTAKVIYGGVKLFTLVWPLIACYAVLREPFPSIRREALLDRASLRFGVVSGLIIVASGIVLMFTPVGEVVQGGAEPIYNRVSALGVLEYFFVFTIFISIFHSGLEEYYWRWFVYGNLSKLLPSKAAHLVAGIGFAAHHVVILSTYFPLWAAFVFGGMVGFGGIIWSLAYERQKTLVGAWVSHMIVDFGIMAIGYKLLLDHSSSLPL